MLDENRTIQKEKSIYQALLDTPFTEYHRERFTQRGLDCTYAGLFDARVIVSISSTLCFEAIGIGKPPVMTTRLFGDAEVEHYDWFPREHFQQFMVAPRYESFQDAVFAEMAGDRKQRPIDLSNKDYYCALKSTRKILPKVVKFVFLHPTAFARVGDDFRAAAQAPHPAAFARAAKDLRAVAQVSHPAAFARVGEDMRAVDTVHTRRRSRAMYAPCQGWCARRNRASPTPGRFEACAGNGLSSKKIATPPMPSLALERSVDG